MLLSSPHTCLEGGKLLFFDKNQLPNCLSLHGVDAPVSYEDDPEDGMELEEDYDVETLERLAELEDGKLFAWPQNTSNGLRDQSDHNSIELVATGLTSTASFSKDVPGVSEQRTPERVSFPENVTPELCDSSGAVELDGAAKMPAMSQNFEKKSLWPSSYSKVDADSCLLLTGTKRQGLSRDLVCGRYPAAKRTRHGSETTSWLPTDMCSAEPTSPTTIPNSLPCCPDGNLDQNCLIPSPRVSNPKSESSATSLQGSEKHCETPAGGDLGLCSASASDGASYSSSVIDSLFPKTIINQTVAEDPPATVTSSEITASVQDASLDVCSPTAEQESPLSSRRRKMSTSSDDYPVSSTYNASVNYLFECWLVSLSNDVLASQLQSLRRDNETLRSQIEQMTPRSTTDAKENSEALGQDAVYSHLMSKDDTSSEQLNSAVSCIAESRPPSCLLYFPHIFDYFSEDATAPAPCKMHNLLLPSAEDDLQCNKREECYLPCSTRNSDFGNNSADSRASSSSNPDLLFVTCEQQDRCEDGASTNTTEDNVAKSAQTAKTEIGHIENETVGVEGSDDNGTLTLKNEIVFLKQNEAFAENVQTAGVNEKRFSDCENAVLAPTLYVPESRAVSSSDSVSLSHPPRPQPTFAVSDHNSSMIQSDPSSCTCASSVPDSPVISQGVLPPHQPELPCSVLFSQSPPTFDIPGDKLGVSTCSFLDTENHESSLLTDTLVSSSNASSIPASHPLSATVLLSFPPDPKHFHDAFAQCSEAGELFLGTTKSYYEQEPTVTVPVDSLFPQSADDSFPALSSDFTDNTDYSNVATAYALQVQTDETQKQDFTSDCSSCLPSSFALSTAANSVFISLTPYPQQKPPGGEPCYETRFAEAGNVSPDASVLFSQPYNTAFCSAYNSETPSHSSTPPINQSQDKQYENWGAQTPQSQQLYSQRAAPLTPPPIARHQPPAERPPNEWTPVGTRQRRIGPSCFRRSKGASQTICSLSSSSLSHSTTNCLSAPLPCPALLPLVPPPLTPPRLLETPTAASFDRPAPYYTVIPSASSTGRDFVTQSAASCGPPYSGPFNNIYANSFGCLSAAADPSHFSLFGSTQQQQQQPGYVNCEESSSGALGFQTDSLMFPPLPYSQPMSSQPVAKAGATKPLPLVTVSYPVTQPATTAALASKPVSKPSPTSFVVLSHPPTDIGGSTENANMVAANQKTAFSSHTLLPQHTATTVLTGNPDFHQPTNGNLLMPSSVGGLPTAPLRERKHPGLVTTYPEITTTTTGAPTGAATVVLESTSPYGNDSFSTLVGPQHYPMLPYAALGSSYPREGSQTVLSTAPSLTSVPSHLVNSTTTAQPMDSACPQNVSTQPKSPFSCSSTCAPPPLESHYALTSGFQTIQSTLSSTSPLSYPAPTSNTAKLALSIADAGRPSVSLSSPLSTSATLKPFAMTNDQDNLSHKVHTSVIINDHNTTYCGASEPTLSRTPAPAAGVSATSPNTAAPLPVYEDRSSLWCSPNTPSPSSVKSQPTITPLTAAPAFHRGATFMMASTTSYATSSACSPYSSDTRHLPAYAPRDTQEKYVEASSFKPRLTQDA